MFLSVKEQALSLSLSVDFSPLHKSVRRVQDASYRLDIEKDETEKRFRELLDNIPKPPSSKLALRQWIKWLIKLSKFPIHEFIEIARRVQRTNAKLTGFEKGFISTEGIKDREWYKHLGVAPGKWLGRQCMSVCKQTAEALPQAMAPPRFRRSTTP